MSRIRTVKPEWTCDEKLNGLGDAARVMSIALVTLSDDYGNGRASVGFLAGAIWSSELVENPLETLQKTQESLKRLSAAGYLTLYEVRDQRYAHICNWEKHQKVNHPGKPQVPGLEDGTIINENGETTQTLKRVSRDSLETLLPDQDQDRDQDQDLSNLSSSELDPPPKLGTNHSNQRDVREVFEYWQSNLKPRAVFDRKRSKRIADRLREGFTVSQLKEVVDRAKASPFHNGENDRGRKYLDVVTIFRDASQVEAFLDGHHAKPMPMKKTESESHVDSIMRDLERKKRRWK